MIKEQNISLANWNNLIILDACRFDIFKKVYRDYLHGKLEKRISNGSNTGEWLVKTFPNKFDYTYISANPYINSYGIPLNKCRLKYRNYSWNAIEHFSKIVDVWEFGWNKKLNTVTPIEVNKAYLSNKDNKKTIIHYMQPHLPYLSYIGINEEAYNNIKLIKDAFVKIWHKHAGVIKRSNLPILRQMLLKLFKPTYQLSTLERLYREIGIDKLHYYEDNLRMVLKYVSHLIEEINGKTIITTDHGEAFGEQGIWEHPLETHIPVLIEVPWLEVKKSC